MGPFDSERLNPTHWLADVSEPVEHPTYLLLAVLMILGLGTSIYVRVMADHLFHGNRFKQRQAARLATAGLWLFSFGLVILLFRWQPVPLLSKRIWLYLWWLAAAAVVIYAIYYYLRRYPAQLALYHDHNRRRRYMPRATASVRVKRRSRRRR